MPTNKEIMESYMRGFKDELTGRSSEVKTDSILDRAYNLGSADAIVGDDVTSSDYQTEKQIINRILRH